MHIHGIVMSGILEENPPGSDVIEMVLRIQGVGAGQPRRIVIPYEVLLRDPNLEPDTIAGHAFQAEVVEVESNRWVVRDIAFAQNRVLREEES
jgi:hypothetical protein